MHCPNNKLFLIVLTLLLSLFLGCEDPNEVDEVPDPIANAHKLKDFFLAGSHAELYSTKSTIPFGTSTVYIYFPDDIPADITTSSISLELRFISQLDDNNRDQNYIILNNTPEGLLLSAPTTSPMLFNEEDYFFSANISPYHRDSWRLDITWDSPIVNQSVSYIFAITEVGFPDNIIPISNDALTQDELDFDYLVEWVTPIAPTVGYQHCTIKVWKVIGFGQIFEAAVNHSVKVYVDQGPPQFVNPAEVILLMSGEEDGLYEGEVKFYRDDRNANVTVIVEEETITGSGTFVFYPRQPTTSKNEDQ